MRTTSANWFEREQEIYVPGSGGDALICPQQRFRRRRHYLSKNQFYQISAIHFHGRRTLMKDSIDLTAPGVDDRMCGSGCSTI